MKPQTDYKKWASILVLLIALSMLMVACAAESVEFPYGTYKSRGGRIIGFSEDGLFTLGFSVSQPVVSAPFTTEGDQVTLGLETNLGATGGNACEVEGTYNWALEEDVLSFTLVDDGCGDRAGDLDGVSYFIVEEDAQ